VPKEQALVLLALLILGFEALRLILRFEVPGLRPYEAQRPCAPVLFAVAVTIAFLLFPMGISLPVIAAMGWVDPLIGELRRRRSDAYPLLPLLAYSATLLVGLALFYGPTFPVLLSAVLVSPIALFLEAQRFRLLDDDLVLVLVPLLLVALVLGQLPW
jgi:dolichol kinase